MSYALLKLLHVAGVIIFLGNIITGHFWMHMAMKSKDFKIIRHSINGVMRSDRVFTMPAVFVIIAGGILAAIYGSIPLLRTGWILWSIALFALSGVIFSTRLSVVLRKMLEVTSHPNNEQQWNSIEHLYKQWNIWAVIAIMMPFIALIMMVLKIPA